MLSKFIEIVFSIFNLYILNFIFKFIKNGKDFFKMKKTHAVKDKLIKKKISN